MRGAGFAGPAVLPRMRHAPESRRPPGGSSASCRGPWARPGSGVRPGPAPAPPPAPQGLPPWVIGALAGAAIVIILLLIVIFSRIGTTPAPPSPPPPTLATPGAPAASLQDQLEYVLATLRNAQLEKNIDRFMSVYSQSFPTYDLKRQDTLKYWQGYDFTNLVFTVSKVQATDPDHATASVIWYVDVRNRQNKELSSATQKYQVQFVKENGNWRIIGLNEMQ